VQAGRKEEKSPSSKRSVATQLVNAPKKPVSQGKPALVKEEFTGPGFVDLLRLQRVEKRKEAESQGKWKDVI
jgi:hypothetical protein